MRVLIIGGYGTFGLRMAQRLSNEADLEVVLAGRSLTKAEAVCAALKGPATFISLCLDRDALALDFKPDLIVDASGPFQAYERQSVVDYALANGVNYADISDDGAFVAAVKARGDEARAAGISLISGLSTCPVLSAIGLREIEAKIGPVTDVTIGIAPSPKAELGRNVVAAVANYAGQEIVPVLREGQNMRVAGLTETRRETICVPGDVPLPRLVFAVADSPDALTLPTGFSALRNIWTGAGTRPVWLLRLLIWMSRMQSRKRQSSLAGFADFFHWGRGFFRFGSHRGGMFVRGSNGKNEASWHLVAEGNDGPIIPALPVVALIRKMLRGDAPSSGAYSGDEVINLSDLQPEFDDLAIQHGLQFDGADLPVYEKVLGENYESLHSTIRDLHRTGKGRTFRGECNIKRGRNPLSHLVATLFRFPKSGKNIPVEMRIIPEADGELWERYFDGKRMASHHAMGRGKWSRHITERFGPLAIHMAILEEGQNLRIETQGWSAFGIPIPKFLRPGGEVYETEREGRFVFHVDLKAPLFGRLCKYEGWLEPL